MSGETARQYHGSRASAGENLISGAASRMPGGGAAASAHALARMRAASTISSWLIGGGIWRGVALVCGGVAGVRRRRSMNNAKA